MILLKRPFFIIFREKIVNWNLLITKWFFVNSVYKKDNKESINKLCSQQLTAFSVEYVNYFLYYSKYHCSRFALCCQVLLIYLFC